MSCDLNSVFYKGPSYKTRETIITCKTLLEFHDVVLSKMLAITSNVSLYADTPF